MRFATLILKNLTRRSIRSGLTLMALSTAIGCVLALIGIANGFTRSFADVYLAHHVDLVVSRQGSADRLSSSVDENFGQKIAQLPMVSQVAGVLLDSLSLEDQGVFGVPTMGIEPDSWLLKDYRIAAGKTLSIESAKEVLLGVHLAERIGVSEGGDLNLFDQRFKVRGIYESPSAWENGSMVMAIREMQELIDRKDQVTYFNVALKPPLDPDQAQGAIQAIKDLDPRLLPLATEEFVKTDTRMQLASAMAWMTSIIALVIGTIGTLNTMMTSVFERTKEIGILRAIGWSKKGVIAMILAESCSLAMVACILGSLFAVILTWGLSQAPIAKGILRPYIDFPIFAQGWLMGIGIGLVGAWLPAWRASQLLPTSAFRES